MQLYLKCCPIDHMHLSRSTYIIIHTNMYISVDSKDSLIVLWPSAYAADLSISTRRNILYLAYVMFLIYCLSALLYIYVSLLRTITIVFFSLNEEWYIYYLSASLRALYVMFYNFTNKMYLIHCIKCYIDLT